MRKVLVIIIGVVILAGGSYIAYAALKDDPKQTSSTTNQSMSETETEPPAEPEPTNNFTFADPKKAAHYVSNTPEHGAILEAVPTQVTITFNFDLSPDSSVTVAKEGQSVSIGTPVISDDNLILTQQIDPNAGPGLYTVAYTACWPDGSCHDGQFQFGVKE